MHNVAQCARTCVDVDVGQRFPDQYDECRLRARYVVAMRDSLMSYISVRCGALPAMDLSYSMLTTTSGKLRERSFATQLLYNRFALVGNGAHMHGQCILPTERDLRRRRESYYETVHVRAER